jgi:hypothetical protein
MYAADYAYKMFKQFLILAISILLLNAGCKRDVSLPLGDKAKKLMLIVIDGVRYTDAFVDSTKIEEWQTLQNLGTTATRVYNEGVTNTVNGLSALSTGTYFNLINSGSDTPTQKTFLHYYLSQNNLPYSKAAIISSKGKINVLRYAGDALNLNYAPYEDCGTGGGYRPDDTTLQRARNYVQMYKPDVLLLHLSEPDISGHSGKWEQYKTAIKTTLNNVNSFYNYLESIPEYKGQTDYFISNDHGRHTTSFSGHGDNCDGCKHLYFLGIGPDFSKGKMVTNKISQIDIPATAAAVLGVEAKIGNGKVQESLLLK